MDDVDVVIQEDGLGVDMELPFCDALQLVGPGDLAVDDAVAGIFSKGTNRVRIPSRFAASAIGRTPEMGRS